MTPETEMPVVPAIEGLRDKMPGQVLAPNEKGYEEAKFSWNVIVDHQPSVVVVAKSEADVEAAVRYANENDLAISIQATGHGQQKVNTGGMLISTSEMKAVTIDPVAKTARIQGGAKWLDVMGPAFEAGLAPLSGSSPYVGAVGYMVGGGINLMVRKYGLGVDHLRWVRIVTPDGVARTASATENPELFWALKGGGGAYGVITEIEIDLVEEPMVYGGAIIYPFEMASQVFEAFAATAPNLPNEVTANISLMNLPPVPFVPEPLQGKQVVIVNACVCADAESAAEWLKPLTTLGGELMAEFGMMPYTVTEVIHNEPKDPLPALVFSVMLNELPVEATAPLLEAVGPMAISPNLMIQIRHLGGAARSFPNESAAYGSRRQAEYFLYFLGVPMGPATPAAMSEQAARVFEALAPWSMGHGPLNFVGAHNVPANVIRAVYEDADYARLIALKRELDPKNLFSHGGIGIA